MFPYRGHHDLSCVRFRTPAFATIIAGILVSIPAGLFDVGTLAEMTNIGTLFAFILVSVAGRPGAGPALAISLVPPARIPEKPLGANG